MDNQHRPRAHWRGAAILAGCVCFGFWIISLLVLLLFSAAMSSPSSPQALFIILSPFIFFLELIDGVRDGEPMSFMVFIPIYIVLTVVVYFRIDSKLKRE
jgi:hypothetical protein